MREDALMNSDTQPDDTCCLPCMTCMRVDGFSMLAATLVCSCCNRVSLFTFFSWTQEEMATSAVRTTLGVKTKLLLTTMAVVVMMKKDFLAV